MGLANRLDPIDRTCDPSNLQLQSSVLHKIGQSLKSNSFQCPINYHMVILYHRICEGKSTTIDAKWSSFFELWKLVLLGLSDIAHHVFLELNPSKDICSGFRVKQSLMLWTFYRHFVKSRHMLWFTTQMGTKNIYIGHLRWTFTLDIYMRFIRHPHDMYMIFTWPFHIYIILKQHLHDFTWYLHDINMRFTWY